MKINIYQYCIYNNLSLRLQYMQMWDKPLWRAEIKGAELKRGGMLIGRSGEGETPQKAIEDYVFAIKGETIVIDAYGENRKEFKIPSNIEGQ